MERAKRSYATGGVSRSAEQARSFRLQSKRAALKNIQKI
ncbi:hypothetical protein LEP1GSC187_3753 [Leptospira santarosai str. ZUN179]|uniref:Uncharacterized protein n=1 Tax=Leptospira santarosai str. ZUN179 TaxID=1049985 RepID=M6UMB9_9LEPT|nr:hypothetical protein LEP1GSC076_1800 [Leptospira sp. Fiocruz LV4135]EMO46277.1 hypothetical protein LEP1GSC187_3753 [Leptospira santarosai str. ZUN179]EMP82896.1 hypothetical protein LEP1GSC162_3061 [Leptospira santarosai str. CBC1531]